MGTEIFIFGIALIVVAFVAYLVGFWRGVYWSDRIGPKPLIKADLDGIRRQVAALRDSRP